jgi:hypothetical protein
MYGEVGRTGKEAFLACLKVSRKSPGRAEENHAKCHDNQYPI